MKTNYAMSAPKRNLIYKETTRPYHPLRLPCPQTRYTDNRQCPRHPQLSNSHVLQTPRLSNPRSPKAGFRRSHPYSTIAVLSLELLAHRVSISSNNSSSSSMDMSVATAISQHPSCRTPSIENRICARPQRRSYRRSTRNWRS